MARGVNKVILIGNLGKDPESRAMPNGKAVTNFSVATSESWRDKQTGEMKEQTEWHNVVMFDRLAEIAKDYLRKGSKVYIEGRLRTRKWQDKAGQDRYTTEITANEMQLLDSKGAGGGMGAAWGAAWVAVRVAPHVARALVAARVVVPAVAVTTTTTASQPHRAVVAAVLPRRIWTTTFRSEPVAKRRVTG